MNEEATRTSFYPCCASSTAFIHAVIDCTLPLRDQVWFSVADLHVRRFSHASQTRKGLSGAQQLAPCTAAAAAARAAAATSSKHSAAAGCALAARLQQQRQQQLEVLAAGMCHRLRGVLKHIRQPLTTRGPLLHATTLHVDSAAAIASAAMGLTAAWVSAAAHGSSNPSCRVPRASGQQAPVLTASPGAPATRSQVLLQLPASKHCQASLLRT
jgi:hypothetical protein